MHDDQDFDSRLSNFAQGSTDAEVAAHLTGCDSCRDSLFPLQHLIQYLQTTGGTLTEPPPSIVAQASGLLARVRPDLVAKPHPVAVPLWERARQLEATLILDTSATPQVAGLRGAPERQTRQLAFVSDIADLDLEVSRVGDMCSVAGQLGMDRVPAGLKIRFVPADQAAAHVDQPRAIEVDVLERGHFTVTLPAASWVASVEINDAVVLFPGVRL